MANGSNMQFGQALRRLMGSSMQFGQALRRLMGSSMQFGQALRRLMEVACNLVHTKKTNEK